MNKKINHKKGFLIQLKIILTMLCFNFLSFFVLWRSYTDVSSNGDIDGRGFLPIHHYDVNLNYYIPFSILFIIMYYFFWKIFLRKQQIKNLEINYLFTILFIIILILFSIIELFLFELANIFSTPSLFSSINGPRLYRIINLLVLIYLIIKPIYEIINILKNTIIFYKKRKTENNENKK